MDIRADKIIALVATGVFAACGGGSTSPSAAASGDTMASPQMTLPAAAGTTANPAAAASGSTARAAGGSSAPAMGATSAAPTGGSAGTLSAGGSGTPAATSAAAGSGASALPDAGNYFSAGSWHGYAWTSVQPAESAIMPMDFSGQTTGMPRCVKGSVAMTTDYSGIAMLGFNLNQDNGTNAPQMTVTPMKSGIMVDIANHAMSPLRLQVQTPNGGMNEKERWCAPISGAGGFIPWASFNTACWDGSGTAYAKEPISTAMVLVPGTSTAAVPFDFCVNSLVEADGAAGAAGATAAGGSTGSAGGAGAGGSVSAGDNSGTGSITERYGNATVMRDGRNYIIQNNVWGDNTEQNIAYDGTTYEITKQTGMNVSNGANAMGPVSYPSVFIGSNYERKTEGSNLPIQVSAIKSVKTAWTVNAGSGVSGTYNAAYDVWFSTSASGDAEAPSGGYLMVWFYKPPNAQPIGPQPSASGVTIPGVRGSWDVWIGPNTGNANRPVISYVSSSPIQSLEFDLNAFIQDALKRPGAIQKEWYLSNVFAGFEIWNGGQGLKTTAFYAIVE